MQPVQRPQIVRVLAGPAEFAVKTEIGTVNGLGLFDPSLLEQQRSERVARRLSGTRAFAATKAAFSASASATLPSAECATALA